jgi:hypothetical protein
VIKNFDGMAVVNATDAIAARTSSFMCDEEKPYLPAELQDAIEMFQVAKFAKDHFREHRSRKFARKHVAIDSMVEFSREPLQEPLLRQLNSKVEKIACRCSKWILYYSGILVCKNPNEYAGKIVTNLYNSEDLRDEVMFQLIKQTRGNNLPEALRRTWELFLIVVTIFPSTKDSEAWIRSHFYESRNQAEGDLSVLIEFCHIRFLARCAVGKPLEPGQVANISDIPTKFQSLHLHFGASIYEQLFHQRRSVRRMPVPYIMHLMAEDLLRKGCENCEGVFRVTGDLKRVDWMAGEFNSGRDVISGANVIDIACLFKKWFRDLPDPVCPIERLSDLRTAYENRDLLNFADHLCRAHRLTLMYLIGFLQRLVKSEEKTLMGAKNLGVVFGPNIVQVNGVSEPDVLQEFSKIGIDFVTFLIMEWNTSEMYPLDPKLLIE